MPALPERVSVHSEPSEQRVASRSNIFLAAHVVINGSSHPVTLRDISARGARLTSSPKTAIGDRVLLKRGRLSAAATVVWRTDQSTGLQFEVPIAVNEWLLEGSDGQRRVDRLLARARTGTLSPPAATKPVSPELLRIRLAEEIGFAERIVEAGADALSDDPHVVAAFAHQLQSFELACKILQNVASLLSADHPEDAIEGIGLHEMKARLLRS